MKMNEIEITVVGEEICISQPNMESSSGTYDVYITKDQAKIVVREIMRLAKEEEI